jgi:hypothetical protein
MWRSKTQDDQSLLVWFLLAILGACLGLIGWLRAIV